MSAREGLDDEHRRAAVSAQEGGPRASVIGAAIAGLNGRRWRRLMQKLALTERCEPVGEGIGVGQIDMLAEELQLT
ncbi:MAG: hypothetical protein WA642_25070 [Steroidobacteraceae bacterium]